MTDAAVPQAAASNNRLLLTSAEWSAVVLGGVSSSELKWQWKGNEGVEQTYLSSGVWAAMRDRRLLSARGHPDRLREKRPAEEEKEKKGEMKGWGGLKGERRRMWVKGNQECKAYQGHLARRGQTARSKLLMHIKVNDRLCFLGSCYIIASGMSGSNKMFELVLVC